MCGLAGWFGTAPDTPDRVAAAIHNRQGHRGPDDTGFENGPGWGFVFQRLSILDLTPQGHQPMGRMARYWIVFNGEIYNFLELRYELERAGEHFKSQSDTEVLLTLLATRGADAISDLNGMFSFAFVDTHTRRFILGRDRLGQKPLYVLRKPGHLRFASELKALLEFPDAPRVLDSGALVDFLGLSYIPSDRCVFSDYEKLPPGHVLEGSLDQPDAAVARRYWQLSISGERSFGPDACEELDELLQHATSIRLRSDVPVGVFLSGGIDSGLVAAIAAQQGSSDLLAITAGTSDAHEDESAAAAAVAAHAGLRHEIVRLDPSALSGVDDVARTFDEPFGDSSALPMLAISSAASEFAKVYLAGDGGDEAFGGYQRYIGMANYERLLSLPTLALSAIELTARLFPRTSPVRYKLEKLSLPNKGAAAAFDGLPIDPIFPAILSADFMADALRQPSPLWEHWRVAQGPVSLLASQQALDYSLYLPDDILVKVDRASMAHSIEVRSPFLDHRLVEFAATIARSDLIHGGVGKLPLRKLAQRHLPRHSSAAPKKGFSIPIDEWFRTPEGGELVRDRLLSSDSPLADIIDSQQVSHLFDLHQQAKGRRWGWLFWRLLVLDAWARYYLPVGTPHL